jgi:hypothetical protein
VGFGAVTRLIAPDLTSPLRRDSVLPRSSGPHSTSEMGSGATAYLMAPDPASLFKWAPVLSRVYDTLWVVGIKKGLAALDVQ